MNTHHPILTQVNEIYLIIKIETRTLLYIYHLILNTTNRITILLQAEDSENIIAGAADSTTPCSCCNVFSR